MNLSHLIFTCAGAAFALPIDKIIEVVRMVAPIARLPRAPRYCLGAIDYHGRLVPLLDLGARLGLCAPHAIEDLFDARIVLVKDQAGKDGAHAGERPGLLGYVVEHVSELSDRPLLPLLSDSQRLGGLVTGSIRWHDEKSALVLDLRSGVLLPFRAGLELRRALSELETTTANRGKA